ncbi:MAG: hypothetical protein V8Q83_07090 [Blautia sp.]
MKNKRFLVLLTITAALSGLATGCFGGDDPAEQVIVDENSYTGAHPGAYTRAYDCTGCTGYYLYFQ